MPFIHIRSLPFESTIDVPAVLTDISRDFATENDLPLFHVHTTWEFFAPGFYAKGGETPTSNPASAHPVIVDLLTPDFNSIEVAGQMLLTLARSISLRSGMNQNNIFINHRYARSGMVYDDGEIVRW